MYNSKIILRNHIPHKTPRYINYSIWKECYLHHLTQLYYIFSSSIDSRYDNDVKWKDDYIFEDFCEFIFECSSKYISPLLKDDYYDNDDE